MSDRADPITLVLSRVKDAKKTPNGWQAKCPAHEDIDSATRHGVSDP
jgi:hypothetical protein